MGVPRFSKAICPSVRISNSAHEAARFSDRLFSIITAGASFLSQLPGATGGVLSVRGEPFPSRVARGSRERSRRDEEVTSALTEARAGGQADVCSR